VSTHAWCIPASDAAVASDADAYLHVCRPAHCVLRLRKWMAESQHPGTGSTTAWDGPLDVRGRPMPRGQRPCPWLACLTGRRAWHSDREARTVDPGIGPVLARAREHGVIPARPAIHFLNRNNMVQLGMPNSRSRVCTSTENLCTYEHSVCQLCHMACRLVHHGLVHVMQQQRGCIGAASCIYGCALFCSCLANTYADTSH
jgi:hypothetical protein